MYAVVVEDGFGIGRDELMGRLADAGIQSRTFFCPMNLQPFIQRQAGYRPVECPVAEELWETGLYLPSSPTLSEEDIESVVGVIAEASS
jgi:perosamine synthetase